MEATGRNTGPTGADFSGGCENVTTVRPNFPATFPAKKSVFLPLSYRVYVHLDSARPDTKNPVTF